MGAKPATRWRAGPAVVGGAGSRDGARRRGWARQGGWDREAGTGPGVGSRVGGRGVACRTCWPLRTERVVVFFFRLLYFCTVSTCWACAAHTALHASSTGECWKGNQQRALLVTRLGRLLGLRVKLDSHWERQGPLRLLFYLVAAVWTLVSGVPGSS